VKHNIKGFKEWKLTAIDIFMKQYKEGSANKYITKDTTEYLSYRFGSNTFSNCSRYKQKFARFLFFSWKKYVP
jgi:hypothetical protein